MESIIEDTPQGMKITPLDKKLPTAYFVLPKGAKITRQQHYKNVMTMLIDDWLKKNGLEWSDIDFGEKQD